MSMSISINPISKNLDMYGEPDLTSAYSLSGVVTISVSSPYSLFESRRTARLLLQSISLTFEGQSEIYTHETGYSSLRLCSITRELLPCGSEELSNESHEEDSEPCQWNVVFNLPIPGWLPASTTLGMDEIGIRYGLYATAKFIDLDAEHNPAWSFATLCAPFRTRVRSVHSSEKLTIRRFVLPPQADRPSPSFVNYLVNSRSSPLGKAETSKKRIPAEVLSKIQVLASVPDCVDINETSLPITVRLRTKDLEGAECKRLQITELAIDVIQQERSRYQPSAALLAQYPLPPREMQPPNLPLRDPHPISNFYDVGLHITKELSESVCRTFSLLPADESGRYKLSKNNYAFAADAEQGDSPTWYTMETHIPVTQLSPAKADPEVEEWAGPAVIRPSASSPLFSVSHNISISLTFTYDIEGTEEKARERLNFSIPLCFGQYLPPSLPSRSLSLLDGVSETSPSPETESFSLNLPSYSSLYEASGERKIDYSTPLPLYTPREEEAPLNPPTTSCPASDIEKPSTHFLVMLDDSSETSA